MALLIISLDRSFRDTVLLCLDPLAGSDQNPTASLTVLIQVCCGAASSDVGPAEYETRISRRLSPPHCILRRFFPGYLINRLSRTKLTVMLTKSRMLDFSRDVTGQRSHLNRKHVTISCTSGPLQSRDRCQRAKSQFYG